MEFQSSEFRVSFLCQRSENGIGYWLKKYREECSKNPAAQEEYDLMKENLRLRKELEEAKKRTNS